MRTVLAALLLFFGLNTTVLGQIIQADCNVIVSVDCPQYSPNLCENRNQDNGGCTESIGAGLWYCNNLIEDKPATNKIDGLLLADLGQAGHRFFGTAPGPKCSVSRSCQFTCVENEITEKYSCATNGGAWTEYGSNYLKFIPNTPCTGS